MMENTNKNELKPHKKGNVIQYNCIIIAPL